MLSVKINGKNVTLNKDFQFKINRENPIFNDPDTLAGDYVENMTFPIKSNRKIFGNLNRITSNISDFDFDIEIFFDGLPLVSGTFCVTSFGENYITGDAKLNDTDFFYKIKDLKLTDIKGGVYDLGDFENFKQTINATVQTPSMYPFIFPPFYNPDFYKNGEQLGYKNIVNHFNLSTWRYIFNSNNGEEKINSYPYIPCFYLHVILQQLIKEQLFIIKSDSLNNDFFKKIIIVTNKSVDIVENNFSTFCTTTTDRIFYKNGTEFPRTLPLHIKAVEDVNHQYNENGFFVIQQEGRYRFNFRLRQKIEKSDGDTEEFLSREILRIKINGLEATLHSGNVFYLKKGDILEFSLYNRYASGYHIEGFYTTYGHLNISNEFYLDSNLYNRIIEIKNHVPDIEQIKLFSIIKGLLNAAFFVNAQSREIEIVSFNEIMNKTPIEMNLKLADDWSISILSKQLSLRYEETEDKKNEPKITYIVNVFEMLPYPATPGDYALVKSENAIYIYTFISGAIYEWQFAFINNFEYNSDKNAKEELSFEIPGTIPKNTTPNTTDMWMMPILTGEGITPFNGISEKEDKQLSLLLYHGKQKSGLLDYWTPLASAQNLDAQGKNISLQNLTIEDLYQNYFTKFKEFIHNAKVIKTTAKIKLSDFMRLRLQEKYTSNGITFIIKTMNITISVDGYSFANMEIYKL